MKKNIIIVVIVAVLAISKAQIFQQLDRDFSKNPTKNFYTNNRESFGFKLIGSNNNINIPSQFRQVNDWSPIRTSQNVQPLQISGNYLSSPTSQTIQPSRSFSMSQTFQTSQPIQTSQTLRISSPSQNSQPISILPPVYSVPQIEQIQKMINDNKISELISLIQKVKKSNMQCDAKSAYLADILGKIEIAQGVKSFSNKLFEDGIQNTESSIKKLTKQLLPLQNHKDQLNIQLLKNKQEKKLIQARNNEAESINCNDKKQSEDLSILKERLSNIDQRLKQLINSKLIKEDQLRKIKQDIRLSQQQLDNPNKQTIQKNIAELETLISNTIIQKLAAIDLIIITENQILEIKKTCNIKAADNFSAVNSLAENIRVSQDKIKDLNNQISLLIVEKKKLDDNNEKYQNKINLNAKILDKISTNLKDLKESVLQESYVCNNAINFNFITDNNKQIVLKFGLMTLSSYLKRGYNYNLLNPNEIYIKPFSIFTNSFIDRYGCSLINEMKSAAQKDSKSYTLDSDFSCFKTINNLITKKGTIKSISNKIIEVNGDDRIIYKLILGSCTKIQGIGAKTFPQVDNKIIWKGTLGADGYFLHTAAIL